VVTVPAVRTFRCALTARVRGDQLFGTAAPGQRWLLVEHHGPWPRRAFEASQTLMRVSERAVAAGVRAVLIRRPGRAIALSPIRSFAYVDARPGREGVWWSDFTDERELLDVPFEALGRPSREPIQLVCAHGRHDTCCAVEGRPVAAALAAAHPESTWECSHVGGDRFAANLLLLPSGEMFGGLDPASALGALQAFDAGRIDLPHHRGRVGRPVVEQAAIHHVAVAAGLAGRDTLRVVRGEGDERGWTTQVSGDGRHWRVDLVAHWADAARLTCSAARPERARRLDLDRIEELTGREGL
jgi:hypothetical protein